MIAVIAILVQVWSLPTPDDISDAIGAASRGYTLSLGHMQDLHARLFRVSVARRYFLLRLRFAIGPTAGW